MSSKRFKKVNNYSVKFTPHIIFDNYRYGVEYYQCVKHEVHVVIKALTGVNKIVIDRQLNSNYGIHHVCFNRLDDTLYCTPYTFGMLYTNVIVGYYHQMGITISEHEICKFCNSSFDIQCQMILNKSKYLIEGNEN